MATADIANIGAGIIAQGLNNSMGMQNAQMAQHMQINQAQQLQQMQVDGAKELTQFNNKEAYEMWKKTNYSAQADEMRKAGLNVATMYGKGGQGGSLQSNIAMPSGQNANTPEISKVNVLEGMALANQIKQTEAQEKLS